MGKIRIPKKNNNKRGVSGNFTDKADLKNRFFAETAARQAEKISNDGTYWGGGRCQWGGSHNLDEDINTLAEFFNSLAKVDDEINEIKLSANEQIFNAKKQVLTTRIRGLLGKCRVTSATSVAGICIIWNDFFGKFLKKYLDRFSARLTNQLNSIEKLEPKHQQELLKLEEELRNAESKYNENFAKYHDPNTTPEEKAKYLILVNEATDEIKKIKNQLKYNPLAKLERYDYLDDLDKLLGGNADEPTDNPNKKSPTEKGQENNNPTSNPLEDPQEFFSKYRSQIFLAMAALALAFFIYTQKDEEDEEETKEDKKFLRQIMLLKTMSSQPANSE